MTAWTAAAIRREGGKASAFRADVSKAGDCAAMVEACVARYGGLDILYYASSSMAR